MLHCRGTVLTSRFNFSGIHSLHSEVTEEQYNSPSNSAYIKNQGKLVVFGNVRRTTRRHGEEMTKNQYRDYRKGIVSSKNRTVLEFRH